jgi:SH3 domain protein
MRMPSTLRRGACAAATAVLVLGASFGAPGPAAAEQAWVRAELRLNLRTGPGNNYRIVGAIGTGDSVTILKQTETWTQIRLAGGEEGWIPAGYLQPEPPATIRVTQLEEEVLELRGQLETVTAERESLSKSNERLTGDDDQQAQQIAELTRENARLKGGQRWPEWLTGAGVLCVGMFLGWLWSRSTGRRSSPRIRL